MTGDGKVRVVVRSRRTSVRTVEITRSPITPVGAISSPSGILPNSGLHNEKAIIYESALNEEHLRAIDKGQRLACNLGFELEVVDSGRRDFFGRVLTSLDLDWSGRPTIAVSPLSEAGCSGISQPLVRGR